ncbi:MAG: helix-turn-helix transcriptional regulator [Oscillospiraceae bacterium]|uniref:helix-turn-helix domain-containing protein n=1 Tax=Pseudoflavonifractor sp. An184 TaxID=1965576 RepID=UPI000B3702B1|nr:helix-turn-helix transcriptional regulator [Pseudoflavonifractor sp. An184]MBS6349597.1 helix-turn-helix transcriptional regulator [Oscillospiraceae bacterium]OUP58881.1 transcriptional regulator [Pseudoflavonifractor sp. An184]
MFSKEEFGQRLKKLRLERQENQSVLAEVLGVSVAQISEIENGNKATTLEKFALICEHYQVSADYLLGFQPGPREE